MRLEQKLLDVTSDKAGKGSRAGTSAPAVDDQRQRILSFKKARFSMSGVQYITDENGKKTSVVLDLKVHSELWEDIQDLMVSRSRMKEKSTPLAKVKASLVASGRLRG